MAATDLLVNVQVVDAVDLVVKAPVVLVVVVQKEVHPVEDGLVLTLSECCLTQWSLMLTKMESSAKMN